MRGLLSKHSRSTAQQTSEHGTADIRARHSRHQSTAQQQKSRSQQQSSRRADRSSRAAEEQIAAAEEQIAAAEEHMARATLAHAFVNANTR